MAKNTLRPKALQTLQKLARIAAANDNGFCQCVSCGKWEHYKDMDGGHYIAKGHSSYWALREENVHPQCKGCNGYGMRYGSSANEYTLWMIDYYGRDFIDDMHDKKRELVKLSKSDYVEMIAQWIELIKYHRRRLGETR